MKRKLGLLHTSPAVLEPLSSFYRAHAPDLQLVNLLDDGLLGCLGRDDLATVRRRLAEMLNAATRDYQVQVAMITCSSVPRQLVEELRQSQGVPLLKVDEPMASKAVAVGRRIGVVATFEPTIRPTSELLSSVAAAENVSIELLPVVVDGAYQALLSGNGALHDQLLIEQVERLQQDVDVVVLAQLSMSRVLQSLRARVHLPVLSSLDTSLEAVRELLPA